MATLGDEPDYETSYLDGYDDALVGVIAFAPRGLVALYDWQKYVGILASNLGGVHPSVAKATLLRTTRSALFQQTDAAFLFMVSRVHYELGVACLPGSRFEWHIH